MRQVPLKRSVPLRSRPADGEANRRAKEFKWSAVRQPCAACGIEPQWKHHDAHHVVYKQHLSRELRWDTRNAMPLCDDCHERHHNASCRIPLSALTEDNWAFAREVLGEAAEDYLRRRYA